MCTRGNLLSDQQSTIPLKEEASSFWNLSHDPGDFGGNGHRGTR